MIDVLVGFLGGEVALVGAEFQIESDAFLFRWNPDTSVDVKEGDGFQKPSGAAADAILKVSHRNGLIAYHCDCLLYTSMVVEIHADGTLVGKTLRIPGLWEINGEETVAIAEGEWLFPITRCV